MPTRPWRVAFLHRLALALCGLALIRLLWMLVQYYVRSAAERHHVETAWFLLASLAIVAAYAARPQARKTRGNDAVWPGVFVGPAMVLSLLLYWPSLGLGLLSDDYVLLTLSPIGGWQFWRPLPLVLWSLIHPAFGPAGLHALNVALHGVNAWLAGRLILTVVPGSSRVTAGLGAALFLTFPAAVETVAWSAGIFDVLLVTCSLLYLNAILHEGRRARVVGGAALLGALLSKETAVALPFLAWPLGFVRPIDRLAVAAGTAVVALFAGTRLALAADTPSVDAPLGYFVKELVSRPFATLGVPWTSSEVEVNPWLLAVWPQAMIALVLVGHAVRPQAALLPIVPATWIVASVVPLLGYLFIGPDLEGSRYVYFGLIGWVLLLASVSQWQPAAGLRTLAIGFLVWLVAAGFYGTRLHQRAWQDAATLRDRVLAETRAIAARTGCTSARFDGLPDSFRGAYVFRNGFAEALELEGIPVRADARPPDEQCHFRWTATGWGTE